MEAGDPQFYWQPPTAAVYRRRRPPSPPLFDSSLAIVILPCLALLFLFLLFHTFNQKTVTPAVQYSYNPPIYQNQIQIPHQVIQSKPAFSFRRSWDSLNVVLIIAAILFGVLARRNDDRPMNLPENQSIHNVTQDQFPYPQQFQQQQQQRFQHAENRRIYGYSPRRSFGGGSLQPDSGGGRLRRTSSAYPEFMREEASMWEEENRRLRFFDDFQINASYSSQETNLEEEEEERKLPASVEDGSGIEIKEIRVDDTAAEDSSPASPAPPPPPPPPPPPVSRSKSQRTFESVPRREREREREKEKEKSIPIPEATEPPPTPPRELVEQPEKKLRNTTKEIAMVLASLYSHGKRKRKHQSKSNTSTELEFPPPSPTPPPPPPPFAFKLFKKTTKYKKIHSVSSAPPRPRKPPLPSRRSNYYDGSQSPVVEIPNPPPLPPFGMRFSVVRGGEESSRAGSPELEDEVDLTTNASRASVEAKINGGDASGPPSTFTCPSPDVNAKADSFIARHHSGWRLEKLNSWRHKRTGPDP